MENTKLYTNRICLDLDDTLVDYHTGIREWYNKKYGTNLKKKDFTSYAFNKVWGGTLQEATKKVDAFALEGNLIRLLPLEGAIEAVDNLLQRGKKLFIITSRSKTKKNDTEKLLDKYFRNKFYDVFYSVNPHRERENGGKTKAEICTALGSSLIDDSLAYVIQCHEEGIEVILFGNYPWNQTNSSLENVIRADNWEEVLEKVI